MKAPCLQHQLQREMTKLWLKSSSLPCGNCTGQEDESTIAGTLQGSSAGVALP